MTDSHELVPDNVIPRGSLPPLRYRDLPEPVPIRKMVGPSIILAGLALGSGEFILWPYITVKSGFVFMWACVLAVATQYFLNMEIMRWTLATGESAITGFCRLSRHWAWVFLILNLVPWVIPAWAKASADLVSWLIHGVHLEAGEPVSPHVILISIAGLWLCGLVLVAGPVVYETVEKIQMVLVAGIVLLVLVLALLMVRPDAVIALAKGIVSFGSFPVMNKDLTPTMLLGALAFAGAGGTVNLGQSNYIKDKGYAMGRFIGRITSPITGREEPITEVGYHFPATPENLDRWRRWWRAASLEHFVSFFLTCIFCLVCLTLIAYSIYYQRDGRPNPDVHVYSQNMAFVAGEAQEVQRAGGNVVRIGFLLMGIAILMTTEFGLLDVVSRISTDIVKANWLRESRRWTESRLYYLFVFGMIAVGTVILAFAPSTLRLFELTASLNGAVMFVYSITLLVLNLRSLPRSIAMPPWRAAILVWSTLFYGFFTVWVIFDAPRLFREWMAK
ncbi:MAG: Nramp family divalent metal transporter [Planctomycetia bacterium]|nr:Nramp family divalent metal transporter [Planctomycetia bacterium]